MALSLILILFSFSVQASLSEPVTIDKLESFLTSNKIQTLEKFLEKLPKDIKKRFTLIHSSKSLQGGTFQNPRVLMFTPNAQMMLTFNGDKTQRGGETIELFLFNKDSAFEAHELDFSGNKLKINRNPQKCFGCHAQPLKPNWNNFNFWIDVYGSNNHHLTARKRNRNDIPDHKEYTELEKFKKTYDQHPRYKYMIGLKERYELNREIKTDYDLFKKPLPQIKARPNSELTELVSQMNFTRITKNLKKHSEYPRFKYAFLSLMSCDYVDFKKSLGNLNFNINHSPLYDIKDYSNPLLVGPVFDDYLEAFQEAFALYIGKLDTNFFFRYLKKEDGSNQYDPINRFTTPGNYGQEFAAIFAGSDTDLAPFILNTYKVNSFKPGGVYRSIIDCERLAAKSSETLSK